MKRWAAIAEERLVERSVEKKDFAAASKEWYISDLVVDNYRNGCTSLPSCELCLHERLRWQFEIKNRDNGGSLLVGSTCITKFDFGLSENDAVVFHGEIRDRMLEHRIRVIRDKWVRDIAEAVFSALGSSVSSCRMHASVDYWHEHGSLSPAYALDFAKECRSSGIEIPPQAVTITVRTLEEKIEIVRMSGDEFRLIEPLLDAKQRSRCSLMRDSASE